MTTIRFLIIYSPGFHEHARPGTTARKHTEHLYLVEEVLASLTFAVRRAEPREAVFWVAELIVSGLTEVALDELAYLAVVGAVGVASPVTVRAAADG